MSFLDLRPTPPSAQPDAPVRWSTYSRQPLLMGWPVALCLALILLLPGLIGREPWRGDDAEQFGIIASDPQAAKTIATLQRRMVKLRERIDDLADWMAKHSDHEHADLSYETTQLRALQDLAGEWCADFEEGLPEGFGEGLQPNTAPPSPSARKVGKLPN